MSITADQERRFYDHNYSRFLDLPDHALAVRREVLEASFSDPSQTGYERRRLYGAAMAELTAEPLTGKRALDYGCGPSDWGVWMATEGAHVTLLDLSPASIELGLRRARASGVAERVRGVAHDASNLSCFRDGEFDLVFANAALHHTLKYPRALAELVRVIAPRGRLVLAEMYGNNPILNAARRLRARLAHEPEDQGEEIILSDAEIGLLRSRFQRVDVTPMNLLAMGKRLLRGRFERPWARALVTALERTDAVLLTVFPFARRYCGETLIVAMK